jgi:hypothetical protein
MRCVGVKKGNVISEQENELFRDTYDVARWKFLALADDWWERGSGLEMMKEWDGDRIKVSWVAGDTRTEVEIWLERA